MNKWLSKIESSAPSRALPFDLRNTHVFYKQHFYKQRQAEIGKQFKQILSNTLTLNFFYLKIIHIFHAHYHPKIIGHILQNKQKPSVSVFMRLYN